MTLLVIVLVIATVIGLSYRYLSAKKDVEVESLDLKNAFPVKPEPKEEKKVLEVEKKIITLKAKSEKPNAVKKLTTENKKSAPKKSQTKNDKVYKPKVK